MLLNAMAARKNAKAGRLASVTVDEWRAVVLYVTVWHFDVLFMIERIEGGDARNEWLLWKFDRASRYSSILACTRSWLERFSNSMRGHRRVLVTDGC
jgi:hypothetical protein